MSCIVKKRSDFEHKINGRGALASNYTKYAAYEMNLESLRQKRTQRLGIKATKFSGQRKIFFVLECATRKFPGDVGLWMQYVTFARRQRSNKKVSEILTHMLRLFPTKSDLWIYAARYALEVRGDMSEARTYMQKGLRLCKSHQQIWVEYARLELIQIAKLAARNKVLGLDKAPNQPDQNARVDADVHDETLDRMMFTVKDSGLSAAEDNGSDGRPFEKPQSVPEKLGAIPIAIFDAAMEGLNDRCQAAWAFFDMVAEIDVTPRGFILNHIMNRMQSLAPYSVETLIWSVKQPMIGVDTKSSEYPKTLAISLDRYHDAIRKLRTIQCRQRFHEHIETWIAGMLDVKDLEMDVCKVLRAMLKKTQNERRAIRM